METRKLNLDILKSWANRKISPKLEIAFKAGVSQRTVDKLFAGQTPARQATMRKIAIAIEIDLDILFPIEKKAA